MKKSEGPGNPKTVNVFKFDSLHVLCGHEFGSSTRNIGSLEKPV